MRNALECDTVIRNESRLFLAPKILNLNQKLIRAFRERVGHPNG